MEEGHVVLVIVAVITAIPATVAASAAWYTAHHTRSKVDDLTVIVNGRIDQLLKEAKRAATAEAMLAKEMAKIVHDAGGDE